MSKERMREVLTEPLTAEFLAKKANEGWRPVAVEWQRDSGVTSGQDGTPRFEVPFGLEVASDGVHLRESDPEMVILRRILARIVEDCPLSEIAEGLNQEGAARRDGSSWTQSAVFELLPRVIEAAPGIYASKAWQDEHSRLRKQAV